ncbi:hypothetical protein Ancab_024148 [Ancistrocladus abbreviatus]
MKPEVLGSCIVYWTARWLSWISFGLHNPSQRNTNHQVRRTVIESLVRVLPAEENAVSCNFLLHLLKVGSMLKMDMGLSDTLEKRIALMLEQCHPLDLLVKNYGESDTLYDVRIIARVVGAYASIASSYPTLKMFVVERLVDGFPTLVARDENLPAKDFQLLAEALPKDAWYSDDNLYRTVDLYLKGSPKPDRGGEKCCMQNHGILEAVTKCTGASHEEWQVAIEYCDTVMLVEQEWRKTLKEWKVMKQETERMKVQLSRMPYCIVELKRLLNSDFS